MANVHVLLLLRFVGTQGYFSMQLLQLAFMTPILFDFYNYDIKNPQFFRLLVKFTQVSFQICLCYECLPRWPECQMHATLICNLEVLYAFVWLSTLHCAQVWRHVCPEVEPGIFFWGGQHKWIKYLFTLKMSKICNLSSAFFCIIGFVDYHFYTSFL